MLQQPIISNLHKHQIFWIMKNNPCSSGMLCENKTFPKFNSRLISNSDRCKQLSIAYKIFKKIITHNETA